jgi:hypothetical protein
MGHQPESGEADRTDDPSERLGKSRPSDPMTENLKSAIQNLKLEDLAERAGTSGQSHSVRSEK